MHQPVAAIDLGTNSARLLIANPHPFEHILLIRSITRLGGGFTKAHGLSAEAQARSLACLKSFAAEMARHGVGRVRAVATSAVRDAANGAAFCRRVEEETGIRLEVIDGYQEALYTLEGVRTVLHKADEELAVFDIGGGSTEYTLAAGGRPVFSRSLPVGVVRLTEGKGDAARMEDKISRELEGLKEELFREGALERFCRATLVGTAGTATTLAAITLGLADYDYRKVNNFVMPLSEVERIYRLLLPMSSQERLAVAGMEPGREDLVVAGILVVLHTMRTFGFDAFTVSDAGLLEGLILSVAE